MNTSTLARFARHTGAVAAAAALAITLSGCSVLQGVLGPTAAPPVRDAATQEITESGQADVFSIQVGDCMNEVSGDTVYDVPVVPCGEPHDEEAYFEHTFTVAEFPGDDAVYDEALDACYVAFPAFAGISYEESTLDFYPFTPTKESWEQADDRVVTCMIYDPSARTTGSLAGAAR
ncbi:YdgH/BhsA/McbA family protein [Microterricola pindariensis]|uniref:hypothetical protein n=1 Tax=Microterricola pindariensis TaxID=478010 RepID=UPI000CEC938D|nr:hypothetical protein [Microterricola pindariensis]